MLKPETPSGNGFGEGKGVEREKLSRLHQNSFTDRERTGNTHMLIFNFSPDKWTLISD